MFLHRFLIDSAASYPDNPAVVEPGTGQVSYKQLELLSARVRDRLRMLGIGRGDCVALLMHKSIDTVAAIYGILRAGAAYVPIDVTGPLERAAYIMTDCEVKAAFVEGALVDNLNSALAEQSGHICLLSMSEPAGGEALRSTLDRLDAQQVATRVEDADNNSDDLAYILYTSGSTGLPKGVPLTHNNAVAFVDWVSDSFAPTTSDVFSAHAPFHFDLSILDLYTPIKHGACLTIITESVGKEPAMLAQVIADSKISIWYSAPSILTMLLKFGNLAEKNLHSLRTVLFAGEVFPVTHLRALMRTLPEPKYFNLYGPTETNVCTYQAVPADFASSEASSLPIGKVCKHLKHRVIDTDDQEVPPGERGELVIAGANVMAGYWNLPEQTSRAFLTVGDERYYRTGDIVVENDCGEFIYVGRRDRMVKKRGYRIELGEIEVKLHQHPEIVEIAAVAVSDDDGVTIVAHYASDHGERISGIKLKRFSSENLPLYMVPDKFVQHESLPKTSTDKTDYKFLENLQ